MTSPDKQSTATADTAFTKTWRYKVGLTMIVFGNLCILIAMALPALGIGAGTVGAVVVGGEIVSMASIVFLGKQGFKTIKAKFFTFIKSTYSGPVGSKRHYIGILLFLTNIVTSYIVALYLWAFFGASSPTTTPPLVWSLNFFQQETLVLWLFIVGEISFLTSFYVLGAEWWGRFRRIFVWEETGS